LKTAAGKHSCALGISVTVVKSKNVFKNDRKREMTDVGFLMTYYV